MDVIIIGGLDVLAASLVPSSLQLSDRAMSSREYAYYIQNELCKGLYGADWFGFIFHRTTETEWLRCLKCSSQKVWSMNWDRQHP